MFNIWGVGVFLSYFRDVEDWGCVIFIKSLLGKIFGMNWVRDWV